MLQYVALFIVILAVMAAMNGFLFLMLRGLSRQLKEQVNSCFLRQLEFTDAIYEEKREKLNRLKEEENTFLGIASASPVRAAGRTKGDNCKNGSSGYRGSSGSSGKRPSGRIYQSQSDRRLPVYQGTL